MKGYTLTLIDWFSKEDRKPTDAELQAVRHLNPTGVQCCYLREDAIYLFVKESENV